VATPVPINKILVPVDLTDSSRLALRYAIELGNALGASTLDVLHVWDAPGGQTLADFVLCEHGETMQALLADAEHKGRFVVHGRLEVGQPAPRSIVDVAEEGYDLIVMGSRAGLDEPSVTEEVARNARCPVFTVREGADEPE